MDAFSQFVSRWSSRRSPAPVPASAVAEFEESVALALPHSYVRFVTEYGFPSTPDLLSAIVQAEADLWAIQDFEPLDSMASTTATWEAGGMPAGFLAFANDCMGNLFLFKKADCNGAEDAPVWFFDHDLGTVQQEADSFSDFIARYAAFRGAT